MTGRPKIYAEAAAKEICDRLAQGESLRSICALDHIPSRETVHRWVIEDVNGFAGQYTRAREVGLDEMADELLEISDDGRNDWMKKNDPDNKGYEFNGEAARRSHLRMEARKWYLSKLAPKRYGDKLAIGGDAENPLRTEATLDVSGLPTEVLAAIIKARKPDASE